MTHTSPNIHEQYKNVYPRADAEPGIICMIATYSRERALDLMIDAAEHYLDRGIVVRVGDAVAEFDKLAKCK